MRVAPFAGFALIGVTVSPLCGAQTLYFIPGLSASAQYESNHGLSQDAVGSPGYLITGDGYLKRLGRQSDLTLHPLIQYGDFTRLKRMQRFTALLDLDYGWRTQRGELAVTGEYLRTDLLNAQFGQAGFTQTTDNPNGNASGTTVAGIIENRYTLEPTYAYKLTQLMRIEADVREDHIDYSSGGQTIPAAGYDFQSGTFRLVRQLGPRWHFGAGPYVSHFKSSNLGHNTSTGYGIETNLRYEYSEITRWTINLSVDLTTNAELSDSSNAWSLTWNGTTKLRLGSLRYSLGRFIEPSDVGSRTTIDTVRVQWIRPVSLRFAFNTAASYSRLRIVGNLQSEQARDRANLELLMNYNITPTITLAGGYRFASLNVKTNDTGYVHSHGVILTLAYRGLDPHAR
jgi:hypothetical protein